MSLFDFMKTVIINQSNQVGNIDTELINPNSKNFDFELWAIAVRSQMLRVFAKSLITEKCEEESSINNGKNFSSN